MPHRRGASAAADETKQPACCRHTHRCAWPPPPQPGLERLARAVIWAGVPRRRGGSSAGGGAYTPRPDATLTNPRRICSRTPLRMRSGCAPWSVIRRAPRRALTPSTTQPHAPAPRSGGKRLSGASASLQGTRHSPPEVSHRPSTPSPAPARYPGRLDRARAPYAPTIAAPADVRSMGVPDRVVSRRLRRVQLHLGSKLTPPLPRVPYEPWRGGRSTARPFLGWTPVEGSFQPIRP